MVDIHVTDNKPFINQTAEESVTQRNLWNRLEIQNIQLQTAWPILKLIMYSAVSSTTWTVSKQAMNGKRLTNTGLKQNNTDIVGYFTFDGQYKNTGWC